MGYFEIIGTVVPCQECGTPIPASSVQRICADCRAIERMEIPALGSVADLRGLVDSFADTPRQQDALRHAILLSELCRRDASQLDALIGATIEADAADPFGGECVQLAFAIQAFAIGQDGHAQRIAKELHETLSDLAVSHEEHRQARYFEGG